MRFMTVVVVLRAALSLLFEDALWPNLQKAGSASVVKTSVLHIELVQQFHGDAWRITFSHQLA